MSFLYTYGTKRDVSARCHVCGKEWTTANAQAVAARHCAATGHTVGVEVFQTICYKPIVPKE